MSVLLAITLAAQAILFGFTAISFFAPSHRVWPPPRRDSWQLYATWFLSWVSLSGVFLLAVFDANSLGLPTWFRIGFGIPLLVAGVLLIAWAFRALTISTTLGVPGGFVRSGPYRFSRNPQYLGTCIYLTSLVALSGSHLAATAAVLIGLWFLATPFVEEPWLAARYGEEYAAYRRAVPRFFGIRRSETLP